MRVIILLLMITFMLSSNALAEEIENGVPFTIHVHVHVVGEVFDSSDCMSDDPPDMCTELSFCVFCGGDPSCESKDYPLYDTVGEDGNVYDGGSLLQSD